MTEGLPKPPAVTVRTCEVLGGDFLQLEIDGSQFVLSLPDALKLAGALRRHVSIAGQPMKETAK